MRSALRPGDVAVDVGAYKGAYTYWMRRAVGDGGSVLAFEPQPAAAAMLRRYVSAFGWTNVTVSECALSSSSGTRPLISPALGPSPAASLVGASLQPGAEQRSVEVDALDRYFAEHPPRSSARLLKVDVEGHELEVFLGARETLEKQRPLLLFECEARHLRPGGTMEDVFSHLERQGYRGAFFLAGRLTEVARFDPRVHQIEGVRPYVNNFLFVPVEERS